MESYVGALLTVALIFLTSSIASHFLVEQFRQMLDCELAGVGNIQSRNLFHSARYVAQVSADIFAFTLLLAASDQVLTLDFSSGSTRFFLGLVAFLLATSSCSSTAFSEGVLFLFGISPFFFLTIKTEVSI